MIKDTIKQFIIDNDLSDTINFTHSHRYKIETISNTFLFNDLSFADNEEILNLNEKTVNMVLGVSKNLSSLFQEEEKALQGAHTDLLDYDKYLDTCINEDKWFPIIFIRQSVENIQYEDKQFMDFSSLFKPEIAIEPHNLESLFFNSVQSCLFNEKVFNTVMQQEVSWPPKKEQILNCLNKSQLQYNFGIISFIKAFFAFAYLTNHPCEIFSYGKNSNFLGEWANYSHIEQFLNKFENKINLEHFIEYGDKNTMFVNYLETYAAKKALNKNIQHPHNITDKIIKI